MFDSQTRSTTELVLKCEGFLRHPVSHASMASSSFRMNTYTWTATAVVVAIAAISTVTSYVVYPGLLAVLVFFRFTKPTVILAFSGASVSLINAGLWNNAPIRILSTVRLSSVAVVDRKKETLRIGDRSYRIKNNWDQVAEAVTSAQPNAFVTC